MKTVIALWHESNKGKTESLRAFGRLLLATYPLYVSKVPVPAIVPATHDFRMVVEINGKIIGIESKGDPGTGLWEKLEDLADNYHCDIILCSTRTRGSTVEAVDNLWKTRGFQTIWTSTYQIDDKANHLLVNSLKAKHLLNLLQSLGLL